MAINLTGSAANGGAGGTLNSDVTGVQDGIADGTVTITGGNYSGANAFEKIRVGNDFDGILTVQGGAVVEADAAINDGIGNTYGAIIAGFYTGSTGIINVDGIGSRLYSSGQAGGIRIGVTGTGTMNVSNGGSAETFFFEVARNTGSYGTVNIDGAGSQVIVDDSHGNWFSANYAGEAGLVRVGRSDGSHGYLNITNGGLLEVKNTDGVTDLPVMNIANDNGSYGFVKVDGAGSRLNVTQIGPQGDSYNGGAILRVGRDGQGILEVSNNAQVNVTGDAAHVYVSRGEQIGVIDPKSELRIVSGGDVLIDAGVDNGGTFHGELLIALRETADALVLVNGAGSTLTTRGGGNNINLGRQGGTGELRVEAGGVVDTGSIFVGGQRDIIGTGTVTVTGTGSKIDIQGYSPTVRLATGFSDIFGFNDGVGVITVTQNASINISGLSAALNLGQGNGAGPTITQSKMYVTAGGIVNVTSPNGFASASIGSASDGNGYISIDGTGSQLNLIATDFTGVSGAFISVGNSGQGTLKVTNGGTLAISGGINDTQPGMNVGRNAGSQGAVTVDGVGSMITVTGDNVTPGGGGGFIQIGRNAGSSGSLTVTNGGVVQNDASNGSAFIGRKQASGADPDAQGALLVDGTNSLFDAGLLMIVGADFTFADDTLNSVLFSAGGDGDAVALNSGTIRAGNFAVGDGGTLAGNGTFDGDVTLDGTGGASLVASASLAPGISTATMNITGNLDVVNGTILSEVTSTGAGQFDQIAVTGAVEFTSLTLQIVIDPGFAPTTDDNVTLVSAGTSLGFAAGGFSFTRSFTGLAAGIGTVIADTGIDLELIFLNDGISPAILNLEPLNTSPIPGTSNVVFVDGVGSGSFNGDNHFFFDNVTTINGTSVDDNILGAGSLAGFSANGGAGVDVIEGGGGNDVLRGDSGNDNLDGNDGEDTLRGGNGNDTLAGGAGADDLRSGDGDDTIQGNDGNDFMLGEAGNDDLFGGNGNDNLKGNAGIDKLRGNGGDDKLFGGSGNDDLRGGAGIDLMYGDGDDDFMLGEGDNDFMYGGLGNDNMQGGVGNDKVKGNDGDDTLQGNAGDDKLFGGAGIDDLSGGDGVDLVFGDDGADTVSGGLGNDFVYGGKGDDTVNGDDGDDRVRGNLNNDTLNGGNGDDILFGGGQNDTLNGDAGADSLFGDNGKDVLFGGAGNDVLTGGIGGGTLDGLQDTFVYVDTAGGGGGFDRVKDFENGIDLMNLQSFGFANFAAVQALSSDSGVNMRINFGGGDVLFVENFQLADFDVGDVLL